MREVARKEKSGIKKIIQIQAYCHSKRQKLNPPKATAQLLAVGSGS